ncbi:MAG: UDP-N-acetylglucosamine 4,6-dehydratase (inverting) [Pseudomonadota bacterium]
MNEFLTPELDLNGASILITGGTGSFGKALLRNLIDRYEPRRVIVFSRDELKQYEMEQEISAEDRKYVRFFIGDVRDVQRLELAMRDVDVVVHAAALKHVPAAEYNPFECVKTNIHGAENIVTAALRTQVPKVIALSTDKAANPINLYGASKLASDKIFVAANNLVGRNKSRFSVVRYGNVLGSRGSVIPFFRKIIADSGAHLPITHPDMTRFWITLQQGVNFVLSSLAMMQGGEIFVPKIPSMKIVDLAQTMAPHLEQKIVGIRPGEKLHEVMITADDARSTIELDDRYIIQPSVIFWSDSRSQPVQGRPLPEDFVYASNVNPDWLDNSTLENLLAGTGSALAS